MDTQRDHNIWPAITYDDPHAARTWLAALGFAEGIVVEDDDGVIQHSEMLWPEGGRVMISSRTDPPGPFDVAKGEASVYVVVDDPDDVWHRAEGLQAEVVRPMEDADYGSQGFSIKDSEGNRWSFGTYAG
ncbi:VOC family protein [Flexivirga sp. B27]